MNGVLLPYLPTALWALASGLTVCLVGVSALFYWHYKRSLAAVCEEGADLPTLRAEKEQLRADVKRIKEEEKQAKGELLRLEADLKLQAVLFAALTKLESDILKREEENQALRREVGELEHQRGLLTETRVNLEQTLNGLRKQIEDISIDLGGKNSQLVAIQGEIHSIKSKLEQARLIIANAFKIQTEVSDLKQLKLQLEGELPNLEDKTRQAKQDEQEASRCRDKVRNDIAQAQVMLELLQQDTRKSQQDKEALEYRLAYLTASATGIEAELQKIQIKFEQAHQKEQEAKTRLEDVHSDLSKAQGLVDLLQKDCRTLQQDKESVQDRLANLIAFAAGKENELKQLASATDTHREDSEIARKAAEQNKAEAEKERQNLAALKQKLEGKKEELRELDGLERRKVELENEINKLEKLANDLKDPQPSAYADLLGKVPSCFKGDEFQAGAATEDSENTVLEHLQNSLRKEGFRFHPRVVNAFHTALKCHDINPLTVLAGVSGTGKTLLPKYYARLMGMHCLVVAVQPRWDSPQDLFGFYNYLERQYKATDLSRALVRMDRFNYKDDVFTDYNGNVRDKMLLVLMDEMNLARTEYYFSEFLSKLELRRDVKNPYDNVADRSKAEIELEAGPLATRQFRLWVSENVLFVGTMNEDETTQTLSDKVLDRANVLRFGKPDKTIGVNIVALQHGVEQEPLPAQAENGGTNPPEQKHFLPENVWRRWRHEYQGNEGWASDVEKWIAELNDAMEGVDRPFGHRVHRAMVQYVANYPTAGIDSAFKLAFADQMEQKILPKLRGLDMFNKARANQCLDSLQTIVGRLGDGELSKAFGEARDQSNELGMFQWKGVSRVVDND